MVLKFRACNWIVINCAENTVKLTFPFFLLRVLLPWQLGLMTCEAWSKKCLNRCRSLLEASINSFLESSHGFNCLVKKNTCKEVCGCVPTCRALQSLWVACSSWFWHSFGQVCAPALPADIFGFWRRAFVLGVGLFQDLWFLARPACPRREKWQLIWQQSFGTVLAWACNLFPASEQAQFFRK